MADTQVELKVPELSKFSGELDNVVKYIGQNIQVITESINVIRRDQEVLFYTSIPGILSKQNEIMKKQEYLESGIKELSTKMEKMDNKLNVVEGKVNDLAIQTNEILTKLLPLIEGIKNIQYIPTPIQVPIPTMPTKLVNTKYCQEEISDVELDALDMDQLKRLKQNIASTKYKYKKEGKNEYVVMCDRNTEKINLRLKITV